MKNHIIGFAVFSLIVGSAVFAKALFSSDEKLIEPVTGSHYYIHVTKNSCRATRQKVSVTSVPVVKQVFLDRDTKRVDWEIATPDPGTPIALHFFSKTSKGARYITSEVTPITTPTSYNGLIKYSSTYMELNNFEPYENLYVVPEMLYNYDTQLRNFNPKFDEDLATPVTVFSGR